MQLSIEAIIILVIAMVLLGLGIAFIQGFFKIGTQKLEEPFSDIQFGCNPSSGDPVKTSPTEITLKSGNDMKLRICYYAENEVTNAFVEFDGCVCTSPECDTQVPNIVARPLSVIPRTEIGKFDTILVAENQGDGSPLPPASYICSLNVKGKTSDAQPNPVTLTTSQVTITIT